MHSRREFGWSELFGFSCLLSSGEGVSLDPFAEMATELSAKADARGVHRVAVLEFKMVNSQGAVGGRVVQETVDFSSCEQRHCVGRGTGSFG